MTALRVIEGDGDSTKGREARWHQAEMLMGAGLRQLIALAGNLVALAILINEWLYLKIRMKQKELDKRLQTRLPSLGAGSVIDY
jgi:hypothetical protein